MSKAEERLFFNPNHKIDGIVIVGRSATYSGAPSSVDAKRC